MHSNLHYCVKKQRQKYEENKRWLGENTESEKLREHEETRCV